MTTPRALVVLVGPMASGKSKIGRRVARLLGVDRMDTDKMVVATHGPIADIFDSQGEAVFRQFERAAVVKALAQPVVVSLGGGAVLNRDTLADLGRAPVVYLTVSPEVVATRLVDDKRPLLREGGLTRWKAIFDERRALYESVADATFDTSHGNLDRIADDIAHWIRAGYPRTPEVTHA